MTTSENFAPLSELQLQRLKKLFKDNGHEVTMQNAEEALPLNVGVEVWPLALSTATDSERIKLQFWLTSRGGFDAIRTAYSDLVRPIRLSCGKKGVVILWPYCLDVFQVAPPHVPAATPK